MEKRVLKLKQEGSMLKKMNRELTSKLRESEQHMIIYKERLKSLCLDVTKVASFSKEHLIEKGSNIKLTDSGIDNAANWSTIVAYCFILELIKFYKKNALLSF